jgi:hypothetical protein
MKNEAPALRGLLLHCPIQIGALMFVVMKRLCLNNAINGANIHTLVFVEVTFAFNTFISVNFENHIAFKDSFCGAYWFTSGARNAIIQDF